MNYGFTKLTPAVRALLIINVVVFGLQVLLRYTTGGMPLENMLALVLQPQDNPFVLLEVWRPFTYMFLHLNFWHLFLNMLGLVFMGIALEECLGTKRFLSVYCWSGSMGGLCALAAAQFGIGGTFLVGASAAIMGVVFAFITLNPNETIMFWALVLIPVRAVYMGIGLLIIELFSIGTGNTSYTAHFSGIATGFLMARFSLYGHCFSAESLSSAWGNLRRRWRRRHLHSVGNSRISYALAEKQEPTGISLVKPQSPANPELELIDKILAKISQDGLSSLTTAERALLDKHSRSLRQ